MPVYDEKFFGSIEAGAQRSAEHIIPMVLDLSGAETALDVGSGSGAWSKVLSAHLGREQVFAVDGPWVPLERRANCIGFYERDLATDGLGQMSARFDLAVCLEVAEHLPESSAAQLVADLTTCAEVVVFSAAVPGQPGKGHVNCQWPEWWADLFRARGYTGSGWLRWPLWSNDDVEWWYRQNLLIFWPEADRSLDLAEDGCPSMIRPELYDFARRRP